LPLLWKNKNYLVPMNKTSTKYFLITQNDKEQIDNLLHEELVFDRMAKELETLIYQDEPSDNVISKILSFVSNER